MIVDWFWWIILGVAVAMFVTVGVFGCLVAMGAGRAARMLEEYGEVVL